MTGDRQVTEAELAAHLLWLRETLDRVERRCERIETDVNTLLRSHVASETLSKQHAAGQRAKNLRLGFAVTIIAALTSGLIAALVAAAFPAHGG